MKLENVLKLESEVNLKNEMFVSMENEMFVSTENEMFVMTDIATQFQFHRTDLVICCHSREGKAPYYSQINTEDPRYFWIIQETCGCIHFIELLQQRCVIGGHVSLRISKLLLHFHDHHILVINSGYIVYN